MTNIIYYLIIDKALIIEIIIQEVITINLDKKIRSSVYFLMIIFAISVTMLSPMMPVIMREFNLTMSQGGLIMTFQSIGGLFVTFLLIFMADRYNKALLIIAGYIIFVITSFAISFISIFQVLLILFFLFGIGTRAIDNLNNSYLAEKYPEKRGLYLNLLHGFFGIGALTGPIFASVLINRGVYWGNIFRILGIFSLLVLIYFIIITRRDDKRKKNNTKKDLNIKLILSNPQTWIFSLMMLLYVGNQSALTTWLPTYMEVYIEAPTVIAGLSLTAFWTGIIVSRFIAILYTDQYNNLFLIKWGNLAGGIILILALFSETHWFLIIAFCLVGFFPGATFALIIDSASNLFPENTGTITSLIFIVLNLSVMFFPWFVGLLADYFTFKFAFTFIGFILIFIFFTSFLFDIFKESKNN